MDRLGTYELRRLHNELESTLTPTQRRLLAVGALNTQMCTPQQIQILERMTPYLEGMTVDQCRLLGVMDTFAEGWEAGEESGERLVKTMWIIFVVGLIIGVLALIAG